MHLQSHHPCSMSQFTIMLQIKRATLSPLEPHSLVQEQSLPLLPCMQQKREFHCLIFFFAFYVSVQLVFPQLYQAASFLCEVLQSNRPQTMDLKIAILQVRKLQALKDLMLTHPSLILSLATLMEISPWQINWLFLTSGKRRS